MRVHRMLAGWLAALLIVFICGGWGFLVHRTVAQLALYQLPGRMQPFFRQHLDYLVRESVRPDLRRSKDPLEAPRHFIDLEMYGDSSAWKMPMDWEKAVGQYSLDSLLKYGYVPYVVIRLKGQLTQAFKNRDADSILYYAADISHYIGDANVPLHVTVNYDGQLTNQKGLHALWESMIPELELDSFNLYSGHQAKYLSHPEAAIWEAIRRAHGLLPELFEQEKEASRDFTESTKFRIQQRKGKEYKSYTTDFARAYSKKLGKSINDQLLHSANMIADFWYTSWVDGGKPDLSSLLNKPWTQQDIETLVREEKDYRQNQLLVKNGLLSRQMKEASGD